MITKNLEKDVFIDKLTLLYNRHSFQNEVKRRIWISRKDGVPVSILIIDIDFFKKVNDTFGHIKGDEVLSKVAHIIKSQIRGKDLAFRFGGEEFIVVLPGVGKDEALTVAERIRKAVEDTEFGIGKKITVSCGIAEYSPGETLEQLIDRADKALYEAKNSGRNRCVVAEDN
ncbi:GGDEF domain-containing protein [Desulfurobacterium atlanticum]|uniref:GGDEF domain-containing protein n=1 Tax=Desulfurobacterium atlanticum TaxID=240169 RepID=UPI001C5D9A59|nr:GGDEF domain-containing protein [Desulfurobacterium atlanticum]